MSHRMHLAGAARTVVHPAPAARAALRSTAVLGLAAALTAAVLVTAARVVSTWG